MQYIIKYWTVKQIGRNLYRDVIKVTIVNSKDVRTFVEANNVSDIQPLVVDNAVPLLDNSKIKKLLSFREDNESVDFDTYEFHVNNFLKSLLQNGVETAKENPNCKNVPHVKCNQLEEGCAYPDCGHENF